MFAERTMRWETELLKWILMLILATALAFVLLARTAAGATPDAPRLLPGDMQGARPMTPPQMVDPNEQIWEALRLQREGHAEEAIMAWKEVTLPIETEVWRQIAMGAAGLQLGQTEKAAEWLDAAEQLEPQNPLVHYYLALLRLDQARDAKEWHDAIGPTTTRLVAYRPRQVVPNTRGMYELAAMAEFEAAIANAAHLDRAMVLAMPDHRTTVTLAPVTVGDVLVALGAERFEGQAHYMLGAMCLDRGATTAAETHLDAAHAAGVDVVFGYEELGAMYEKDGRYGDAARAYLKGTGHDPRLLTPLRKVLENAAKALLDG